MAINTRAQSAVELLSTYSWALLIMAIFIAAVLYIATGAPAVQVFSSDCNIQPLIQCQDSALLVNSTGKVIFVVEFINKLQTPMLFAANAINVSASGFGKSGTAVYNGQCFPGFALPGSRVVCKVSAPAPSQQPTGTQIGTYFTLNYTICQSSNQSSCPAQYYSSTGYSVQSVASQSFNFVSVSFVANGLYGIGYLNTTNANGIIFVNGVPYSSGQTALFTATGNYVLNTQPPPGYLFVNWSVGSPSSSFVAPSNTQNSLLTLVNNATITATYTEVACNVCYIRLTGSPLVCPATCTTIGGYIAANGTYRTCIITPYGRVSQACSK